MKTSERMDRYRQLRGTIMHGRIRILEVDTVEFTDWLNEIRKYERDIENLKKALNQTDHFITFTDDGWSIEHLVECRPEMTACEFHKAAQKTFGDLNPGLRGRFKATVIGGDLLVPEDIGERTK
ncbi:MAG: hypothetical protein GTO24_21320 [candidate division Zixibacteria bacterium]|nr:hypothetical protein [candidate division Zixibacteria bacterium]